MKNKILVIGILIVALSVIFAACVKKDDNDIKLVTGQKPGDIVTDKSGVAITDVNGNAITVANAKKESGVTSKSTKKNKKNTNNSSNSNGNVNTGGNSNSDENQTIHEENNGGVERGDIIEVVTEDPNKPKTTVAPGTTSAANSGGVKIISGDSKNDDSGDATINFS